jgi:nitrate/TMAO reductase-like tetraheme cytochrome c subunit
VPEKPHKSKSPALLDVHIPGAWIAGVLAAVVVLLIVAVVGFSAVNRVGTCSSCHVIKPEVTTYEASAHYRAGVTCQQCHTKPGVFNYAVRNLEGVTNLVLYVSNRYEKPITTSVSSDTCVQCHPASQLDEDMVVGTIRVNHKALLQAGYTCLDCHADVAHQGTNLTAARVSQNVMSICARCHDGATASAKCDLCHINGIPASAPKVAMNAQIDPKQCAECHKQKSFCASCHNGLPMPHPAGWTQSHGTVVDARGANVCASCHTKKDPQFCVRCHGLAIPHPANWQTAHAAKGLSDPSVCVKCHGQDSCIRCHGLVMPHPANWQDTHGQVALNDQALCLKCHSNTSFCTACHGVSLPHSSSFIANHPSYVPGHGELCVKCHHNNGAGPNGCYGGGCHSGSIN